MQNREELLAAVDRAMSALEIIRRYLTESPEEEPREAAFVPEPPPEEAPVQAAEPLLVNGAALPVFSAVKEMGAAARTAASRCREWQYRDVAALPVDAGMLIEACEAEDRKNPPDPTDAASFYLVSPEGALGATRNNGAEIDWIFLPLNGSADALPKSLGTAAPQPAPAPAPQPTPASAPQPASQPTPASAPQPAPAPAPQPAPRPAPEPVREPAPEPAPRPRFCRSCGARLTEGARFCIQCGWRIE